MSVAAAQSHINSLLRIDATAGSRTVIAVVFVGNPWEQARDIHHEVKFGGKVVKGEWVPKFSVSARAYDCPIPGWKTDNCGNLRLWDALPTHELDLSAFNKGEFVDAVAAKRQADAIVSVLYPNDATAQGKLLRLEQQYFFVSASMQVQRSSKFFFVCQSLLFPCFFSARHIHCTRHVCEWAHASHCVVTIASVLCKRSLWHS
jgi:hypothetical protein